jgi:hypothetical protein
LGRPTFTVPGSVSWQRRWFRAAHSPSVCHWSESGRSTTSDLYGRIGYAHSELKFNANGPINTGNRNDSGTKRPWRGGGVNFSRNWGVFAEWMKNDRIRVDSYLAGVDFRF